MMGNRQELFKQETVKASNVGVTLARLVRYFAPYWYMVVFALTVMIISNWMTVTTPQLMGQATDCFLVQMGAQNASFGSFGQTQSENSESSCWLGTSDTSSLTLTQQIIYKAYMWNDFPAPTDA